MAKVSTVKVTHVQVEVSDKERLEIIRDYYEYSSIRAVVKLMLDRKITEDMIEEALLPHEED